MNRFLKVVGLVAFLIMLTNVNGYTNPTLKHFNDRHYKRLFDKGLDVYGLDVTCRDSADMELLKRVCDTVYLMVGPDHYNIRVSREGLKQLQEHDFMVTPLAKCYASGDDLGENQVSSSPTGVTKIDTTLRETLFFEDFEGDWENTWLAWDYAWEVEGADFWGTTTAKSFSPSHSLWCTEDGDLSAPGPYAPVCAAHLLLREAISNMVRYADVKLQFGLWIDLPETGYPSLLVTYTSDPDSSSDQLDAIRGSYPMWDSKEYALPTLERAYLEFIFDGNWNEYGWGGVYLDDIVVSGRPLPNLRPHKPSGWADTIVVSSSVGTHSNDTLYGGEPMYVDFAIINEGPGPSGPFHVGLFEEVDFPEEVLVYSDYVSGLQPGQESLYVDIPVTYYSDESVELHVRVDYIGAWLGEVPEWKEFDNHTSTELEIRPPETVISGFIRYVVPNWPIDDTLPAGMIPVEIWEEEDDSDTLLETVYTNGDGQFWSDTIYNNDESDMLDIYVRPLATNAAATVYTSVEDSVIYKVQNETMLDMPSEHDPIYVPIAQDMAAPFFIIAVLREGYDKWGEIRNTVPGNLATTIYPGISCFVPSERLLMICSPDRHSGSDVWDEGVILHEYSHLLQHEYGFLIQPGDTPDTIHGWDFPCENQGLASSEGFAHFYSCLVRDSPILEDHLSADTVVYFDLESGTWGLLSPIPASQTVNDSGYLWEGACASAFWDMYDLPDDDVNNDGIGDALALEPEDIVGFIVDSLATQYGGRVDSLLGLWNNWMRTDAGDQMQLDSVYREHGMTCCLGMTGNVNGDFEDAVDVSDIAALVNHLFVTFEPIICPAEANTSGDPGGAVDISDLTALANYLMKKSRSLPMCQ